MKTTRLLTRSIAFLLGLISAGYLCMADVEIISDVPETNQPALHGLNTLAKELEQKGQPVSRVAESSGRKADYYLIAGLATDDNLATKLLKSLNQPLPEGKESLVIRKISYLETPAILLCGRDGVGLMYAALDTAKRISWSDDSTDPFQHVLDVSEKPEVAERAVSTQSVHRRYFEERLYDTKYWTQYFDMMAEHRLNQFILILGYKNSQYGEPVFTSPAYPYFFNLDEYPYVRLSGLSEKEQRSNIAALKEVIKLAHARGIEFGVGLWDQIQRNKNWAPFIETDREMPADLRENVIWGLTKENLIPYSKSAIRKFFQIFPEVDIVQFRMHWESGIQGELALNFWREIFQILKEESPHLKIEARAKDVPDETLYDGVDTGMDFRVATKHWMEQMGMPFHPTHVNKANQMDRRHGYADLLRFPKRYDFKWRLWNGGTTRVLLWGDPQWVKLFARGSKLYDAAGYEFNEPLFFKMNGSPHEKEVFELLNPKYRYYEYEFERYWHFYQVFGRIGYNPDTPSDIWEMEFRNRFGEDAGVELMKGMHLASKVLPRIVAASYLYSRFPSPRGWAELQRMDDLPDFAKNSKPSDIQQFASPMEEAELILNGGISPKRQPSQTSAWFQSTSDRILAHVAKAEAVEGVMRSNEFKSTVTDLKILGQLSLYHSKRLLAAVCYNLYMKADDLSMLDRAIGYEKEAVDAYGGLVEAAGDFYNKELEFGSNPSLFPGHWRNEHAALQQGLKKLKAERAVLGEAKAGHTSLAKRVDALFAKRLSDTPAPIVAEMDAEQKADPGKNLTVAVRFPNASDIDKVVLRYRRVSQFEDYEAKKMTLRAGSDSYESIIPGDFIGEKYDLMYFVEVTDRKGNAQMLPDLEEQTPYVMIEVNRP